MVSRFEKNQRIIEASKKKPTRKSKPKKAKVEEVVEEQPTE